MSAVLDAPIRDPADVLRLRLALRKRLRPTAYPTDPVVFAAEVLGVDLWDRQAEIARAVFTHPRVAAATCHAFGKSFLAARLAVAFLHARPRSVVITTAPTGRQVEGIIWREINAAVRRTRRPLMGRCLRTRYEIEPDWYGMGFKSGEANPDSFQGFHADHTLLVVDEAAGVPDAVMEALDSVVSAGEGHVLMIGNPTSAAGRFHRAFHAGRDLWRTFRVPVWDTPNFRGDLVDRPYLVGPAYPEYMAKEYGEDSPAYQSRVEARFPRGATNALIPLDAIEAAHARRAPFGPPVEAGVDVARFGADLNALVVRAGATPVLEDAWGGLDTMQTVGRVKAGLAAAAERLGGGVDTKRVRVRVDVIGVGAGVADRLREDGYLVEDVNVARRASDPQKHPNLRAELWWEMRARFLAGEVAGPLSDAAQAQFSDVRYGYSSRHTAPVVEPKEETKRRTGRSPDLADAYLLAYLSPPPEGFVVPDLPAPEGFEAPSTWAGVAG